MRLIEIGFKDLEKYNSIEMKKTFNCYRNYSSKTDYYDEFVEETTIDWTNTEKMSEWRELLNEGSTGIFVIAVKEEWVGGCVVVTHSPQVNMLDGDMSNSVLWDIRVSQDYQKKGLGTMLFNRAVEYAKLMNTKQMLIETQNNNPKAISFYEKQGAKIYKINRNHYNDLPKEDQIIMQLKFM